MSTSCLPYYMTDETKPGDVGRGKADFSDIEDPIKRTFLLAIASGQLIGKAAELVGVDRVTTWRWREADAQFAGAMHRAATIQREARADKLLGILDARAEDEHAQMSTIAAMFLLKGVDSRYRDNQPVQQQGPSQITVVLQIPQRQAVPLANVVEGECKELPPGVPGAT